MTTPRDPGPSVRGGESPRYRPDGNEPVPSPDAARPEDRWTPQDRYVVERAARGMRSDDGDGWEPQARRPRPVWASAALAALLGAILVALVVITVVVLPGLTGPAASGSPSASPSASPTLAAATATPTPSPTPTPTATPAATPLPSVLEVVVATGDSLSSLADEYDTHPRSIAFWNRDRYPTLDPQSPDYEPDQIQVGWTLVVYPGQTFPEPSTTPGASASPEPSATTAP
jgi:hypothetical protein